VCGSSQKCLPATFVRRSSPQLHTPAGSRSLPVERLTYSGRGASKVPFWAEAAVDEPRFTFPTCHAEHDHSFHTFLNLAEDARELNALKLRLEALVDSTRRRLRQNRENAAAMKQEFSALQTLLAAKRGEFTPRWPSPRPR
jgi:hypothetical protein